MKQIEDENRALEEAKKAAAYEETARNRSNRIRKSTDATS